jgi:hypothetical protein
LTGLFKNFEEARRGVPFGGCGVPAYAGEVQCPGEALEEGFGRKGLGFDGEERSR